jgi:hypothetical protein
MQPVPRGPGARLQHQGSNSSSGAEWTAKAWDDTKRALQASCAVLVRSLQVVEMDVDGPTRRGPGIAVLCGIPGNVRLMGGALEIE